MNKPSPAPLPIEPLLTAAEVGAILKCSPSHVMDLHAKGFLTGREIWAKPPTAGRPGRRSVRFAADSVRAFLDGRAVAVEPEAEPGPGGRRKASSRLPAACGGVSLLRKRGGDGE